jgi:chemotaxis signal transduction protein
METTTMYAMISIENTTFAINVMEIVRVNPATLYKVEELPKTPIWVLGAVKFEDTLVPLIDLSYYFFKQKTDIINGKIVFIKRWGQLIAIVVDDLQHFEDNEVKIQKVSLQPSIIGGYILFDHAIVGTIRLNVLMNDVQKHLDV